MGHRESEDSELEAAWRRAVLCATAYDDTAPVEPVLEAAALGVVLEVMGELRRVPEHERRIVRDAARRALLRARPTQDTETAEGEDDAQALRLAASLAREGLRALTGEPATSARAPADAHTWHPPARSLVWMMRGAPDALAAASVALHVERCAACEMAVQIARMSAESAVPLRVAAASAAPMLAPQAGRLVATREAPAAEAIVFEDGRGTLVAIYTAEPLPVRYVAEGLTTEDMRPGYWAGRCAPGAARLEGTLHVGDAAVLWMVDLRT